jgi:hypothetical protein
LNEDNRLEISELIDKEEYLSALTVCFKFERILRKSFDVIEGDDYWYLYYKIALIYCKLKKFKFMKKFADKSSIYCQDTSQDMYSNWLIANYDMNNQSSSRQNSALKRFDRIQCYFERMDNQSYYIAQIMINRAYILKNVNLTLKAINILKEVAPLDFNELDIFYGSLIKIYRFYGSYEEAKEITGLLHNNNLQKKLSKRVFSKLKAVVIEIQMRKEIAIIKDFIVLVMVAIAIIILVISFTTIHSSSKKLTYTNPPNYYKTDKKLLC